MTDLFRSGNNTYFTPSAYNDVNNTQNIPAVFDVTQIVPFLQKASDYQMGLDKGEIPLNLVPLTPYNIPFNKYGIILESNGFASEETFVRQVGATQTDYLYNLNQTTRTFTFNTYSSVGISETSSYTISSSIANKYGPMVVDAYSNLYLLTNVDGSSIFDRLVIFSSGGIVLNTYSYVSAKAIAIAPSQSIYVCDDDTTSTVYKYDNANSASAVTLTQVGTITQTAGSLPFGNLETVCVDSQVIVGYQTNKISIYDTTLTPVGDFTLTGVTQISAPSQMLSDQDRFVICDQGSSNVFLYGDASGTLKNIVDGSTVQASTPYTTISAPIILQNNSSYGVSGADNHTYTSTYNPATQTLGANSAADSSTNLYGVTLYPDQSNFVGYNGASGVYAWQLNNPDNVYLSFDGSTDIGCSQVAQNNYRMGNANLVYALGNDANMYRCQYYMPRYVYTASGTTRLGKTGSAWNTPSTTTCTASTIAQPQPYSNQYLAMTDFDSGTYFYTLSVSGSNYYIDELNQLDCSASSQTQITGSSITTFTSFGSLGAGLFFIAYIDGGGTHLIDIYQYPTLNTPVSTIDIDSIYSPAVLTNVFVANYGPNFLLMTALSNGSPVYTAYNITTPASPTVIVSDVFPDSVASGAFDQYTATTPIYYCMSSDGTKLLKYTFQNVAGWTITANETALSGQSFNTSYFCSTNDVVTQFAADGTQQYELYIPSTTSGQWIIYNYVSESTYGTLTFSSALNANQFVWNPGYITGQYTFAVQTVSGIPGNIKSFCFDKVSTNVMYALSTSNNNVYRGDITGSAIAFSLYITSATAFTNIECTAQTLFDGTAYCYKLSDQSAIGSYNAASQEITSIGKNPYTNAGAGEFSLGIGSTSFITFDPATFTQNYSISSSSIGEIYTLGGADVAVGNYPIYHYWELMDQINAAFQRAFEDVNAKGGNLQKAPVLSIDYSTCWGTLTYSSDYGANGNNILFNSGLLSILTFQSTPDGTYSRYFDLVIPSDSTSITQEVRSLWKFNQLDKILLISNSLYTIGADTFAQSNQANIISDIDVPTGQASYGLNNDNEPLYYQPSYCRPLVLASDQPIIRVQVQVFYQLRDQTYYPLLLEPGVGFTAKLIFDRRF